MRKKRGKKLASLLLAASTVLGSSMMVMAESPSDENRAAELQNVALGKAVTGVSPNGDTSPSVVTDGSIRCESGKDYYEIGYGRDQDPEDPYYIQVDLGQVYPVERVNLWRYYTGTPRTYRDTIVFVSEDTQFTADDIVYNSDNENFFGFGAGEDEEYVETASGLEVSFEERDAQYIRVVNNGHTLYDQRGGHYVEIQAWAQEEKTPGQSEWTEVPALGGSIIFDPGWEMYENEGENGIAVSVAKGAKATLSFYGSGIKWIGQKDINFGRALVYLDGEPAAEVDTYGSAQWGVTHFEKTWSEAGYHTISVEPKDGGTINEDGAVDVEKFLVQYDTSEEVPAKSIQITSDLSDVDVHDKITLETVISPFNATNKKVIYSSSDESVATVDENGKVTIHKAGSVIFTAAVAGTEITKAVEVKINELNLPERRMQVNNENPLLLVHLYGGNAAEGAEIPGIPGQGGATLTGTWNMIPDKVKPYTAIQLHPGFLGADDSATLRTYFEENLKLAQENNINVFLTVITGGNTRPVAADWVNEMFDTYSCLKGLVATENWYGGDNVPNNMAVFLEAAAEKGGYFVWTDANLSNHAMERWMDIESLYNAAQKYSNNFIICSKSTASSGFANVRSVGMGYWLSDLCGNWGALTDSWYWYEKSYWKLFDQSEAPYRTVGGSYSSEEVRCPFQFPETMFSMNMLQTYANGGVVFNFEHPFYCTGINDIPSHALTEAILPVMEYIIDNPAPTKEEVTEATKVVFSSREGYMPSDFQYGLYGDRNDSNLMQNSGRYNTIPIIHKNVDESILERFDAVIDLGDLQGMTTEEKTAFFNQYYPEVSSGDAYVQKIHTDGNPRWLVFNSNDNQNVDQNAEVYMEGAVIGNISFTLTPHTYLLAEQTEDSVNIELNNYRADKDEIWEGYDGDYEDRWNGDWNDYCQQYMLANYLPNPKIDELRPTVISFTMPEGSEKPEIEISGDEGQYEYTESYDKKTGVYTLTVNHNGQIRLSLKAGKETVSVDKTTLSDLIDKAQGYVDDGTADTLIESVKKIYLETLEKAKEILSDEAATYEEVMDIQTKLAVCITTVDMKAGDKTALGMFLESAAYFTDDVLENYVEAGQAEFKAARDEAQAVYDDGDAFEADVKAAYDRLFETMTSLRMKADKTALKALIDMVNGLNEADYTAESFAVMRTALASTQAVYENDQATETEVKEAEANLQSAVNALVKAAPSRETPGTDGGGQKPDSSSTGGDVDKTGAGTNASSTEASVDTGDNASAAGIIAMMIVALAVLGRITAQKNKIK